MTKPTRDKRCTDVCHLVWITNGSVNQRVPEDAKVPFGWRHGKEGRWSVGRHHGRLVSKSLDNPTSKAKLVARFSGTRWVTNGELNRRLLKDDPVPTGWRPGKTNYATS